MANHSPAVLRRKLRGLEGKYEKTNPNAVLTLANIERLSEKYQHRLDNLTKKLI